MDPQLSTVIDTQADIEGHLKAREARILGRFKGELEVSERLVLGESSRVEATVVAGVAELGGEFKGDIRARNVTLTEKARVKGRIDAETLAMREGARFDGDVSAGRGVASV
jgi:cytoskeletal protein CcmA (bactofilin family)